MIRGFSSQPVQYMLLSIWFSFSSDEWNHGIAFVNFCNCLWSMIIARPTKAAMINRSCALYDELHEVANVSSYRHFHRWFALFFMLSFYLWSRTKPNRTGPNRKTYFCCCWTNFLHFVIERKPTAISLITLRWHFLKRFSICITHRFLVWIGAATSFYFRAKLSASMFRIFNEYRDIIITHKLCLQVLIWAKVNTNETQHWSVYTFT